MSALPSYSRERRKARSNSSTAAARIPSILPRRVQFRSQTVDCRQEGKASGNEFENVENNEFDEKTVIDLEENNAIPENHINLKERIRHFTWTWFTMTMATGGIANVLHSVPTPFQMPHLYALGCIFVILNMVLFLFNIIMISSRFYLYPSTFRSSFVHPTESLFIPAAIISFGTILINITQYGVGRTGHWLEEAILVLFWVYCGMAILGSCGIYLLMWSTQTFTIAQMTPIWIFPAYPLLIAGPFASNLAPHLPGPKALQTILGGSILQSLGFLVSLSIYSAFLYRLMTQKLPLEALRPGMFISVGPSAFTSVGVIGMARSLPGAVPNDFMGPGFGNFAAQVSVVMANWWGIWLWGLAVWWFLVAFGAHFNSARRGRMTFSMTWYSFIFPNTALTTSTFAVSTALHGDLANAPLTPHWERPFQCLGIVMTVALIMMWFFVFAMMIRAVWLRQILWPQMQEDRDEGGWGKDRGVRKGERKSSMPSRTNSAMQIYQIGSPNSPMGSPSSPMAGVSGVRGIGDMRVGPPSPVSEEN